MNDQNSRPPLWKILAAAVAIAFILFLWGAKNFGTLPPGEMVAVVALNAVVSLLKMAAVAGVLFALKWLVDKMSKK